MSCRITMKNVDLAFLKLGKSYFLTYVLCVESWVGVQKS